MWHKELGEIINLLKNALLACPVKKYQKTFISISNSSPDVNRCGVASVELILYTGWASPLPFL
jgi:hypothetical protein